MFGSSGARSDKVLALWPRARKIGSLEPINPAVAVQQRGACRERLGLRYMFYGLRDCLRISSTTGKGGHYFSREKTEGKRILNF